MVCATAFRPEFDAHLTGDAAPAEVVLIAELADIRNAQAVIDEHHRQAARLHLPRHLIGLHTRRAQAPVQAHADAVTASNLVTPPPNLSEEPPC